MLLNNFRPLVSFYSKSNFVDVHGDNVAKEDFLTGHSNSGVLNSHSFKGSNLTYDYTSTTGTNNYTKEIEKYKWTGIVANSSSSSNYSDGGVPTFRNGMVLFVGTGDTPVTANDYCLAEAKELQVTGASCTHTENETTLVTRSFINNTSEDVTIKEVGLYVFHDFNGVTNSNYYQYIVMIGRIVLDTPVTMAVGEGYTFTYIIDMSNISF